MRLSPVVPVAALLFSLSACGASGGDDAASTTTIGEETTATTAETSSTTEDESVETTVPGPDADEDASAYTEALTTGLGAGVEENGDLILSTEEAQCVAPEWIEIIGVDTLADADVVPEDLEDPDYQFSALALDTDTGGELIDAFGGCDVDIVGELFDTLSSDLDEQQSSCLAEELDEEMARQFLIEALVQVDLSAELNDELERIDSLCKLS